jgi:hypothetical protein
LCFQSGSWIPVSLAWHFGGLQISSKLRRGVFARLTVDAGTLAGGIGTLPSTVINGILSPGNSIGTTRQRQPRGSAQAALECH